MTDRPYMPSSPPGAGQAQAEAAEALREALAKHKLRTGESSDAVAAALGVTGGAVRQWANNVRPVPIDRAIDLADILGERNPARFCPKYRDLERRVMERSPHPGGYTDVEEQLIRNFRNNPEAAQETILIATEHGAKRRA